MWYCNGCPHFFKDRFHAWLRDYDSLQYLALFLIYLQIGCSLIGSLGALYNGILLLNLAISLFALVAIESSSQRLCRTYAFLLFSSILLDIAWFILFSHPIWNISSDKYGMFFVFSVKLTLAMQIVGFTVRLPSSLLWIQIYRLGVPYIDSGSIYDPAYYSSLFEDGQYSRRLRQDQNSGICDDGSTSSAEASQVKVTTRRAFEAVDVGIRKFVLDYVDFQ
ncbi:hypothetical protein BDE02_03G205100 [Populus trichocarpa]|uniref:Uncharacterized protein n=1 Tax=Populus trichocarpa TaxID=3694 RepID=A0A3N7G895_POPTR|nr:hypothetical protein BDE02_03G205100 [Populus trichocarpa]